MPKSSSTKLRKVTSLILSAALVVTLVPVAPIAAVAEEVQDELDAALVEEDAEDQQDTLADEMPVDEPALVEEVAAEEGDVEAAPVEDEDALAEPEAAAADEEAVFDEEATDDMVVEEVEADICERDPNASAPSEDELSAQYNNMVADLTDGTLFKTRLYDSKDSDDYYSVATGRFTLGHRSRLKINYSVTPRYSGNGKLVVYLKKTNATTSGLEYESNHKTIELSYTTKHSYETTYIWDSSTPSIPAGKYEFIVVYQNANDKSGYVDLEVTLNILNLFNDLSKTHWAVNVVADAVDMGIMSGYNVNTFGTNDPITRGQVATMLWNFAGKPSGGRNRFSDVSSGKYYYKAICWAASNGVVNGYGNGTFRPDKNVTREELATMLRNFAVKYKGASTAGSSSAPYASMSDRGSVSTYARAGVGWCFYRKIMTGNNGKIYPKSNATRAEAAKMFVTLAKLMGKKTSY